MGSGGRRFFGLLQLFAQLLGFVFLAKTAFLPSLFNDVIFGVYGMVVTIYLLSRFVMSVFYRPCRADIPLPSVAIVIPAMNEQSAIERTIEVTRQGADEIRRRQYVELLVEPDLSVLIFRRLGWNAEDYRLWSERLLAEGHAFVTPTTHRGEPCTRFAIVNPRTTAADIAGIIATMA